MPVSRSTPYAEFERQWQESLKRWSKGVVVVPAPFDDTVAHAIERYIKRYKLASQGGDETPATPAPDYTYENVVGGSGGDDEGDALPDIREQGAPTISQPPDVPEGDEHPWSRALGRAISRTWDDDSMADLRNLSP